MGSTVFPAASTASTPLPQGATGTVTSGYASTGGWKYATSTAAGNYQVAVQASPNKIYGIETANGVTQNEIPGGSVVPLNLASTEASITMGSYYPFQKIPLTTVNGGINGLNGGNGLFIMHTGTSYIYTSTDGLTWTNRTSSYEGANNNGRMPSYVNDRWIIPGWNNGATNSGALYSTNGTTWSFLDLSAVLGGQVTHINYAAGTWVACSNNASTTNGLAASTTSFTSGWSMITKPATNVGNYVNYVSYRGTGYWMVASTAGIVSWSTVMSSGSFTNTTVGAGDHYWVGQYNGKIMLIGDTAASSTVTGKIYTLHENSSGSDPSSGWYNEFIADIFTMGALVIPGINYGVLMLFPAGAAVTQSTGTYPATQSPYGQYRFLTSTNGYTWTVRGMNGPIINIRGGAQQQANGILCYTGGSQFYYTTAQNNAAFYLNSTNLTTIN